MSIISYEQLKAEFKVAGSAIRDYRGDQFRDRIYKKFDALENTGHELNVLLGNLNNKERCLLVNLIHGKTVNIYKLREVSAKICDRQEGQKGLFEKISNAFIRRLYPRVTIDAVLQAYDQRNTRNSNAANVEERNLCDIKERNINNCRPILVKDNEIEVPRIAFKVREANITDILHGSADFIVIPGSEGNHPNPGGVAGQVDKAVRKNKEVLIARKLAYRKFVKKKIKSSLSLSLNDLKGKWVHRTPDSPIIPGFAEKAPKQECSEVFSYALGGYKRMIFAVGPRYEGVANLNSTDKQLLDCYKAILTEAKEHAKQQDQQKPEIALPIFKYPAARAILLAHQAALEFETDVPMQVTWFVEGTENKELADAINANLNQTQEGAMSFPEVEAYNAGLTQDQIEGLQAGYIEGVNNNDFSNRYGSKEAKLELIKAALENNTAELSKAEGDKKKGSQNKPKLLKENNLDDDDGYQTFGDNDSDSEINDRNKIGVGSDEPHAFDGVENLPLKLPYYTYVPFVRVEE